VQISGILRDFIESYRSLKRSLLDLYDCDTYIAATPIGDDRFGTDCSQLPDNIDVKDVVFNKSVPDDYQEMVDNYNNYQIWCKNGCATPVRVDSVYAALYKKWQCNQLRLKSGVDYDVVFTTRSDLVFAEPFIPKMLEYATCSVLIPHGNNWQGGINDHFCLGPPKWIDVVCDQVHKYREYAMKHTLHPERNWRFYAIDHRIPISRLHYTYFLRGEEQPRCHI